MFLFYHLLSVKTQIKIDILINRMLHPFHMKFMSKCSVPPTTRSWKRDLGFTALDALMCFKYQDNYSNYFIYPMFFSSPEPKAHKVSLQCSKALSSSTR